MSLPVFLDELIIVTVILHGTQEEMHDDHREIIYRGAISSQLGHAEMTPLLTLFILRNTVTFFVEDDILLLQFRMHMVYQNYDFMNLLQPVFFSSLKSNLN